MSKRSRRPIQWTHALLVTPHRLLFCLIVGGLALAPAGAIAVEFQVTRVVGSRVGEIWQQPSVASTLEQVTLDPLITHGERITIDVRARLAAGEQLTELRASVSGYERGFITDLDPEGLPIVGPPVSAFRFVEGESVAAAFPRDCFPVACVGDSLVNALAGALAVDEGGSTGPRVPIIAGTSGVPLGPTSGLPGPGYAMTPGLDGVVGGGDAHFRLVFENVGGDEIWGPALVDIRIGTAYPGDSAFDGAGQAYSSPTTTITLHIVPEPGTAMMMGLGLAVLAGRPTRRARA